MATPTFDLIAETTLSAAASSITFSSLDQGYTDLVIYFYVPASTTTYAYFRFNGDNGNSYGGVSYNANGSSLGGDSYPIPNYSSLNTTSLQFSSATTSAALKMDINGYTKSKNKSVFYRVENPSATIVAGGVWNNTTPITQIEVRSVVNSYPAGTTMQIFGVVS